MSNKAQKQKDQDNAVFAPHSDTEVLDAAVNSALNEAMIMES